MKPEFIFTYYKAQFFVDLGPSNSRFPLPLDSFRGRGIHLLCFGDKIPVSRGLSISTRQL